MEREIDVGLVYQSSDKHSHSMGQIVAPYEMANTDENAKLANSEESAYTFSSPKRRKIDDDGFVTPATPDIPRESLFFIPPEATTTPTYFDNNFEQELSATSTTHYRPEDDHEVVEKGDVIKEGHEPVATSHVLSERGMAVKMLCAQWSDTFRERELFERSFPDKLDGLLKAALSLEQGMIQQKEKLRQRLQMISQTLHTP